MRASSLTPIPFALLRRGFSLIELLAVLAVVAVLAAIIVPTVVGVRASVHSSQCISNLRNIGTSILVCAQDENGYLPFGQTEGGAGTWKSYIADHGYVGQDNDVVNAFFFCPSETVRPPSDLTSRAATNYIGNRNVLRDNLSGTKTRVSLLDLKRPNEIAMVFDGTVGAKGVADWGFWGQTGFDKESVARANNPVPNETTKGSARISWRHDDHTNAVFADGHAESFAEGELQYRHLQIAY